ncbi:MAG: hypothetical protein OXJ52_07230 [Oligoflexia bacterium]|nr:hypothetical protein [Oligoflexia bacterium]
MSFPPFCHSRETYPRENSGGSLVGARKFGNYIHDFARKTFKLRKYKGFQAVYPEKNKEIKFP